MRFSKIFLSCFFLLILGGITFAQVQMSSTKTLMGSRFDFTIRAQDSATAVLCLLKAEREVSRIEHLISEWIPDTEVSQINAAAGHTPVKVSPEVLMLTKKALYFSKLTKGAFDISIAAMDKIWKFDGSVSQLPSRRQVKNAIRNVGYRDIEIDEKDSTIFLKKPGMKIGFGSIGKAYAADRVRELMIGNGTLGGMVNAAGDIAVWGKPEDGDTWNIGISSPEDPDELLEIVALQNEVIVTSGNYEKFIRIGGKRYGHIINPKTGYPSHGLIAVTVKGKDAVFANGLSTSMMVLGEKKALKLIRKFPEYQYLIITDQNKVKTSFSQESDSLK